MGESCVTQGIQDQSFAKLDVGRDGRLSRVNGSVGH